MQEPYENVMAVRESDSVHLEMAGNMLSVELNGVCVNILLDTGAATSIIGEELFAKLQQEMPIEVENSEKYKLYDAQGNSLNVLGQATLDVSLDTFESNTKIPCS